MIDTDNFSTCPIDLEKKINLNTKAVIIQHTFGYTSKITQELIKKIKEKKIYIVEDCALTIFSSYFSDPSVKSGSIGDAAIYSFDRSKPISSFTGGCLVINNKSLFNLFDSNYKNLTFLDKKKQSFIFIQLIIDRLFLNKNFYLFWKIFNYICRKFFKRFDPYFGEDSNSSKSLPSYNYPSKLPYFLKFFLVLSIKNHIINSKSQILFRENYIELINQLSDTKHSDIDKNDYILRYCFTSNNKTKLTNKLSNILDINHIWFQDKIINTDEDLSNFGYIPNSCPNA